MHSAVVLMMVRTCIWQRPCYDALRKFQLEVFEKVPPPRAHVRETSLSLFVRISASFHNPEVLVVDFLPLVQKPPNAL